MTLHLHWHCQSGSRERSNGLCMCNYSLKQNLGFDIWALWSIPHTQTIFHHLPDADVGAWQTYAWFTGWAALLGSAWYGCARHSSLLRFALIGGILVLLPSSSFAALQENMAEHRSHQFGFFSLGSTC